MIKRLFIDTFIALIVYLIVSFLSIFPYLIPFFPAKDSILEIGFPKKIYWAQYRCNYEILGGWHHTNIVFNAFVIWFFVLIISYLFRTQFQTNK